MFCRIHTLKNSLLAVKQFPETTITRHTRSLRPYIKVRKEKIEVRLDVRNFKQNEITVKAHPEYVIIEGKQERKMDDGYIIRQFVRKFRLPEGCRIKDMETKLSAEGILTVTAPRNYTTQDITKTISIPIAGEDGRIEAVAEVKKDVKDASNVVASATANAEKPKT